MRTQVQIAKDLIKRSKELSKKALDGCCPQTYELMTALLEDVVKFVTENNCTKEHTTMLNSVIKDLLEGQEKDDLLRISDDLGFELPYVLTEIAKKSLKPE